MAEVFRLVERQSPMKTKRKLKKKLYEAWKENLKDDNPFCKEAIKVRDEILFKNRNLSILSLLPCNVCLFNKKLCNGITKWLMCLEFAYYNQVNLPTLKEFSEFDNALYKKLLMWIFDNRR